MKEEIKNKSTQMSGNDGPEDCPFFLFDILKPLKSNGGNGYIYIKSLQKERHNV